MSDLSRGSDNDIRIPRNIVRGAYTLIVIAGVLTLLYLARHALAPYLLALLGIYLLLPIVRKVESWLPTDGRWSSIRRPVAVFSTLLVALSAFVILLGILITPIVNQTIDLIENLDEHWESLRSEQSRYMAWYEQNIPLHIQERIETYIPQLGDAVLPQASGALGWLIGATGGLLSAAIALIAGPLFVIYYLLHEPKTEKNVRRALPRGWADDALAIFRIVDRIMGSYTRGVLVVSVIVGCITGLGYWIVGIDLWLPLAFIAFAGEIVPIAGPWIAFFISFPVILATQPELAIPAGILFLIVQALEGWILAPRVEGRAVQFTPAGSLLLLSIGGAIAGAVGVIFALPAAAVLRALILYGSHRINGLGPNDSLAELPVFQDDEKHEGEDVPSVESDEAEES